MAIMTKILVQPHKCSQIGATGANNNLHITLGQTTEETCSLKQYVGIRLQLGKGEALRKGFVGEK